MFAHVGGVPVEEAQLPLLSGASAALFLARTWLERWISGLRWISVHKRQFRPRMTGKAEAR